MKLGRRCDRESGRGGNGIGALDGYAAEKLTIYRKSNTFGFDIDAQYPSFISNLEDHDMSVSLALMFACCTVLA